MIQTEKADKQKKSCNNNHFIEVEEFKCPNDHRSCVVWGNLFSIVALMF